MNPSKKHESAETAIADTFGFDRRDSIARNRCVPPPIGCGKPATTFHDDLSRREFSISGLCQECQDRIFEEEEGEEGPYAAPPNPDPKLCPSRIIEAFHRYRDLGVPPGDFVRACLENNLIEAFRASDEENRAALPHIVAWLYWEMPSNLWKSPEAVQTHLARKCQEAEEGDHAPERDEPALHDVSRRWDGDLHNRPGDERNPEPA